MAALLLHIYVTVAVNADSCWLKRDVLSYGVFWCS